MLNTIQIKKTLTISELNNLKIKWETLAKKLQIPTSISETLFNKIVKHYNEKHRAYHNLSHINGMLTLLEQFEPINKKLVQLAIWFHDIIYNPIRKDNEKKSAELAQQCLKNYLNADDLDKLYQLILSTQKHQILVKGFDNQLLLDLDLAVLGTSKTTYQQYAKAIRKEYWIYPGCLYRKGRKRVLSHFLERDRLYFTPFFYANYEAIARTNLKSELVL